MIPQPFFHITDFFRHQAVGSVKAFHIPARLEERIFNGVPRLKPGRHRKDGILKLIRELLLLFTDQLLFHFPKGEKDDGRQGQHGPEGVIEKPGQQSSCSYPFHPIYQNLLFAEGIPSIIRGVFLFLFLSFPATPGKSLPF